MNILHYYKISNVKFQLVLDIESLHSYIPVLNSSK